MKRAWTWWIVGAWALFALGACGGGGGGSSSSGSSDGTTGSEPAFILGDKLPGLSGEDQQRFALGQEAFLEEETEAKGVGPVFNGRACSECHKAGSVGGGGTDLEVTRVTRIGGMRDGEYSDLVDIGGPVIQARSLRELEPNYPCPNETVPAGTQYVSHRISTPLFGAGLIEAIPDATILSRTAQGQPDGVQGTANMVLNPETGRMELGRFGWKAQISTLHWFSGDAYLNEMGVTSPSFPNENLPQGQGIPAGADTVADPEGTPLDIDRFVDFMRFLAPASRVQPLTSGDRRGEQVFANIACTSCHTPSMQTGPNPVAPLSNQTVRLYSDLLLHRMGSGLADGIRQGRAEGDQFRTAPLWGLQHRRFLMHDGRAASIEQAILAHGGEATVAKARFNGLPAKDRAALLEFLSDL
jgi:CxxC motif-containing protein (DUF1111 family)